MRQQRKLLDLLGFGKEDVRGGVVGLSLLAIHDRKSLAEELGHR